MDSQFEDARTAAQVLRARPHLDLPADERPLGARLLWFPAALVTTTGRRTGEPRVTPTLSLRDGDRVVLPASFGGRSDHPAWYRNLMVNPEVAVQIRGQHLELVAREATDEERDRYWPPLIRMYPPYKGYRDATDRVI